MSIIQPQFLPVVPESRGKIEKCFQFGARLFLNSVVCGIMFNGMKAEGTVREELWMATPIDLNEILARERGFYLPKLSRTLFENTGRVLIYQYAQQALVPAHTPVWDRRLIECLPGFQDQLNAAGFKEVANLQIIL